MTTQPQDPENPQSGEILPPMLYEDWFAFCMECKDQGQHQDPALDGLIKLGFELAWQQLKPLLKTALPYCEAGVRGARLGQADANVVRALAEFKEMLNEPNEERISRKAASLQWTGNNTPDVMARLAQHGMIGELFREGGYIQVYYQQSYLTTLGRDHWLVEGEDGQLRFYIDEKHKLMYRPIVKDDELERLRAFAREILDRDSKRDIENCELELMGIKHGLIDSRGGLADFLKEVA